MTRLLQSVALSCTFGLVILGAQAGTVPAAYVGTWRMVPGSAVARIQGTPPAAVLTFDTSADALTVKKSGQPYERYALDGTTTRLTVERTGSVRVDDSGMTLITRRDRAVTGNPNRAIETLTDRYVLRGDELLLTRTARYERLQADPADAMDYRWEVRYAREPR